MASDTQTDSSPLREQRTADADLRADALPEPAGRRADALPLLLVVLLLLFAPVVYDLLRWLRAR